MASHVVRAEHKQQPAVHVPGLLQNSYSILAVASARVYHAQLSPKGAEWSYTRLRGTLVLGQDNVQVGDPSRSHNRDNEAENHWFRLLDTDSGRPVWMFKVHDGFSYQVDRPFFHVFQGMSRRFGFLFEDDNEAAVFGKQVTSQTCSPRKYRNLNISRSKSNLRPGNRGTISPMMISAPSPQSFVHVAHVGINNNGVIEATEGVDPSWKTVLSGLQNVRMESNMMTTDRRDATFVDGFWNGGDTRMGGGNSSETTIVETPSCDMQSNPKIRHRMASNATFAAY